MSDPQPPAYGAYATDVEGRGVSADSADSAQPDELATWSRSWLQGASVLATSSIVVAALVMLAQVVTFLSSFDQAQTLADASGQPAGWSTYDLSAASYSVLSLFALVITGSFLSRSRSFAEGYAPEVAHQRARGWAWWGWVVPVVTYWFPFQVVRDVVRGHRLALSGTLGWWWATWLLATWISNRAALSTVGVLGSGEPADLPVYEGIETAALAIAFVLWVRIVTRIVAAQKAVLAEATQA